MSSATLSDIPRAKRWLIDEINHNADLWSRPVPAWRDGFTNVVARIAALTDADVPCALSAAGGRYRFTINFNDVRILNTPPGPR